MSETIAIFERCIKDTEVAPHWHHVATLEDVEDVQDLTPPEDVDPGAIFTFVVIERDGKVLSDINDWPSERLEYGYLDFATSNDMEEVMKEVHRNTAMEMAAEAVEKKVREIYTDAELDAMSFKELDGLFDETVKALIEETVKRMARNMEEGGDTNGN